MTEKNAQAQLPEHMTDVLTPAQQEELKRWHTERAEKEKFAEQEKNQITLNDEQRAKLKEVMDRVIPAGGITEVPSSASIRDHIKTLQAKLQADLANEGLTPADVGLHSNDLSDLLVTDTPVPQAIDAPTPYDHIKHLENEIDGLRTVVETQNLAIETQRSVVEHVGAQRDKYAQALREIIQDPIPNLTHVKIAKAALGW